MNFHFAKRGAQTAERNRSIIKKTGKTLSGQTLWTEPEIEALKYHYPDYAKLRELFPHRTPKAIEMKCEHLNILRKIKTWNALEISKLRRLYGRASRAEIEQTFPEYSWARITSAARKRGLRRPRTPYVRVKSEHMNAVRDRCFELGYTLRDIDALAKTMRYFGNGASSRPRPDMRKIDRAVRALDGKLVVVWND